MNALALLVKELHDGENDMTGKLRRAAHQHATDYDVKHGATHLSTWSQQHVSRLAQAGRRFGLKLSPDADKGDNGLVQQVLDKSAEALGRRPEPALLLLKDLRELHLCAAGNNVGWEMLGQAAKALRDTELLQLVEDCSSQTVRQMKWTNTLIKELSPQAFTSLSPEVVSSR